MLLDLETAGSLALTGDRAVAIAVARSIGLELATYPLGVPIDVGPIGFDIDGGESCDRVWAHTTVTYALRVAQEMLDRTLATGHPSLVAARAATDDDEALLDPHIFIIDTATLDPDDLACLDDLIDLCQPQAGAAVVLIGAHPKARETLDMHSNQEAVWSGVTLKPPVVDREASAQVAAMLAHTADTAAEPLQPLPVVADLLPDHGPDWPTPSAAPHTNGDGETTDTSVGPAANGDRHSAHSHVAEPENLYQPPDYDVLVQLLGEVTVHGRDITAAAEVELLALLVCQRDTRPSLETLISLMRIERGARAMQTRLSRLRGKLGYGADGEELLPRAANGRGSDGRYHVSPRIFTDVELIDHRYHTSLDLDDYDALIILRDGLDLFAGPAFRARHAYEWPWPEGIAARISNIIVAYAERLMELAFNRDDIPLVLETVRRAGHVIEDPVAELPILQLQRDYADECGDPILAASVAEARRRLQAHNNDNDPLAPDA